MPQTAQRCLHAATLPSFTPAVRPSVSAVLALVGGGGDEADGARRNDELPSEVLFELRELRAQAARTDPHAMRNAWYCTRFVWVTFFIFE